MGSESTPRIDTLILDTGPLVHEVALRGIAKAYVTVPQVITEVQSSHARAYLERLPLLGVDIKVVNPNLLSFHKVSEAAKKSGDYGVLSSTDLLVLALAHTVHTKASSEADSTTSTSNFSEKSGSNPEQPEPTQKDPGSYQESNATNNPDPSSLEPSGIDTNDADDGDANPNKDNHGDEESLDLSGLQISELPEEPSGSRPPALEVAPLFEDPPSDDDGEGEWITPDNVSTMKARDEFPGEFDADLGDEQARLKAACMTADYAMQNVLMHLHLPLISFEGRQLMEASTKMLRCHACCTLVKDPTKKFCPKCGNATLTRVSVSTAAPPPGSPPGTAPTVHVHLKKNYKHNLRGTIYSIPLPKPGSRGTNNIILREDQIEFQRAVKRVRAQTKKMEQKMKSAVAAAQGRDGWADPDWMPNMLLGVSTKPIPTLPEIGYGRRNPHGAKRKK
ncbi:Nin one binding Zn-ribbon like-domain-containing protein [Cantharellus anzutake]|uniref:Nin one binding Zn-ribbon like-domain-containing protein n=1 Tax=Cantharellus anzutake TaxID=1750568 RepID=UPI0019069513|nr:Nin one binding Zn-ribbon like-domain-containing protein [Cantharellus anzutake]KAF8338710.1 Nin one binding Zn-ribbon like-domain-containing protein [Cantharellus anzutake]